MASDITQEFNLKSNFASVVKGILRSVESLNNGLGEMGDLLQDMSKAGDGAAGGITSVGKAAQQAGKQLKAPVSFANELRKALKLTGSEADNALKKLDFKKVNLKELSATEIEEFGKALRNAGSSLGQFMQTGKVDLGFRKALADVNELQKLLGKPISTPTTLPGSKQAFAELRKLNAQLRTEITETLSKVRVPEDALGTVAQLRQEIDNLTGSAQEPSQLSLLADLEENRADAERVVQVIDELRQKLKELGPAAENGGGKATQEFLELKTQLDASEKKARRLTDVLKQTGKVFSKTIGPANESLSSQGFDPITLEDIFPSAEQRKVQNMQKKIGTAVRESVRAGAVRQTLNLLKTGAPLVGKLDRNIVQLTSHLPRMRYALYDVSNSLGTFGAGLVGAAGVALKFSADFERAFADVARTTNLYGKSAADEAERLKTALIDITQELPVAFEDVAKIATLAGQLNVANEAIAEFTESVAKFSATTDVTVDAAATAFGRLDQLVQGVNGQFEKLGSSILAVGVNAVATESDIIAISTQIASVANIAGFSASELIGFSSALASVGTRPELARGTFTRLFTEIQQSVAAGGDQLDAFAKTAGQSVGDFTQAWGEGSGADQVIAILQGLNREGKQADQTLAKLGITSVRDVPTLLKLAQSVEEVERQIRIANIGFIEGSALQEQYSVITSTFTEKIKVLKNNFAALAATFGSATAPLGSLVDVLIAFVDGLEAILDNPFNRAISGFIGAATGLFGVFFLLVSVFARGGAALIGFTQATIDGIEAVGLFKASTDQATISTERSTVAKVKNTGATKAGTVATRASTGAEVADTVATNANSVAKVGLFKSLLRATRQTKLFAGGMAGLLVTGGLAALFVIAHAVSKVTEETEEAEKSLDELKETLGDISPFMKAVEDDTKNFRNSVGDARKDFDTFSASISDNSDEISDRGRILAVVTGNEELLASATGKTTDEVDQQTLAIGKNTEALIRQKIAQDLANEAIENIDISNVKELLIIQETISAAASGQITGQTAGGLNFMRDKLAKEGNQVGISSLFEVVTDPALSGALAEAGFDFQEYIDAVVLGNEELAASVLTKLKPAAEEVAAALDEKDPEKYADAIVYLNGVANFGAQGLRSYTSAGSELREAIKKLAFEQLILGGAFEETGEAANAFRDALKGVVDEAFAEVNAERKAEEAVRALGAAFRDNGSDVVATGSEMQAAIKAVLDTASNEEEATAALNGLFNAVVDGGYASAQELVILQGIIQDTYAEFIRGTVNALKVQRVALSAAGSDRGLYLRGGVDFDFGGIAAQQAELDKEIADLEASVGRITEGTGNGAKYAGDLAKGYSESADAAGDTADAIDEVEKTTRTLLDYANDLESVFSRAFGLRFGAQSGVDEIAAAWESFTENVDEARNAVQELKDTQDDLAADVAIKEYFLSVAEAYDDQLRAAKLRTEIADIEKEQADAAKALADAQSQSEGATGLTGQTEQGRANRGALLGLVQNYQSYIGVLAESGASQDELRKATERARKEFIAQATDLGFAESEVMMYAEAFDDVRTAIDRVPRDVTIDFNADPALQALNELNAKLDQSINKAKQLNSQTGSGSIQRVDTAKIGRGVAIRQEIEAKTERLYASNTSLGSAIGLSNQINALQKKLASGSYASGGYTGAGGKYQPAGVVHRGEYVVPSQYVNQSSGLPNANFLSQLQNGMPGYANGGFVGGGMGDGTMMVELSPFDRKLLADAGNVQLRVNGKVVAEATNQNNFNEARRGSN